MTEFIAEGIRAAKERLRTHLDVDVAFAEVRDAMAAETERISKEGSASIPQLSYSDIEANAVPAATFEAIRHRGCAIVRGVFDRSLAESWNEQLGEYVDRNDYVQRSRALGGGGDDYFGSLESASPQIFGIYWSVPQIQARQAESLAATRSCLNSIWNTWAPVGPEFDPNNELVYADRIRRRAPGDTTLGLSPHTDAGSFERWVDPAYQRVYSAVFEGAWRDYDPWSAAHRTQVREYASSTVCSVFRTYQGWTALTPQGEGDGTLQLVPVANAVAYVLLRSLLDDVPEDELILATPGHALGINSTWHPELIEGLVSIPEVEPGDAVFWHPDINHAVEDAHEGAEHANVIYIGSVPRCAKNEHYARNQSRHFLEGKSAPDFPVEDYEVDFEGRATIDDLTPLGRAQMML